MNINMASQTPSSAPHQPAADRPRRNPSGPLPTPTAQQLADYEAFESALARGEKPAITMRSAFEGWLSVGLYLKRQTSSQARSKEAGHNGR
jgi:hypothetical protein